MSQNSNEQEPKRERTPSTPCGKLRVHNGVQEGKPVDKNQFAGRTLGVFTSGGDSQGMNATVRAIVRMGLYLGCKVYLIHEGYQGMIDGEKNFQLGSWASVSGIVGLGGTIIGSARCPEFRERSGRLKAARNLAKAGINNLVCIGGDGTLTGADLFKKEWNSLLDELLEKNEITKDEYEKNKYLNIVGIVGSIDNDFCGTDMTIGTSSALHRIIEAIDAIVTTAFSHQRCFVMEVMGRHCGYLALAAGLASEADWIFIPEHPPEPDWENILCKRLQYHRLAGHRLNIVIVAEGAIDNQGNPITSEYVKKVISSRLKIDTRITILGHVQRGGATSAYDRVLGARLGSEAVLALMMSHNESPPFVIGINGNQPCYIPLVEAVERTKAVAKAMAAFEFKKAIELRGASFERNLESYIKMSKLQPKILVDDSSRHYTLGVMNLGAPAAGVNSVIRSFVRQAASIGCTVLAIQDGFEGLVSGLVKELEWKSVYGWTGIGGSLLGCQRIDAKKIGYTHIAAALKKFKIEGLLLVGGFEAYTSVIQLSEQRKNFQEFCIPLICVPATISNNVPGSDFSIGCDTALNEIVTICDKIKQSALGSKRRVFLVETMGGYCGYLASVAGLASGADQSYIFEEPFTINDIVEDVRLLKEKMKSDLKRGLLIRNEMANKHYTSEFMQNLMCEEGKGVFSARANIIGHMQQGGVPTPFDRNLGIKFGNKALIKMVEILNKATEGLPVNERINVSDPNSSVVVGIRRNQIVYTSVFDLLEETDFEHRLPKKQWWLNMRPLIRILGKHEAVYKSEVMTKDEDVEEFIEDRDEKEDENLVTLY
ncbi:unnamed protein product [Brachionus calyciflorus]|uniref:ATP-dependent 6-phosphofructokinase n=1 Tax=Brachionus calyciflorus TaxID=104777 RepID=A0A814HEN2_9BILA|nr:unnamed protein product [Brachionus calyciflorus]